MGRSASVGCDYEVTEGEARMPHGVASSGTTGSRDDIALRTLQRSEGS
jgi:hypothetical protein